jgi:hypothetical protein
MPYNPTLPQFPLLVRVWETKPPDMATEPDFENVPFALYFPRMVSEIHQEWTSYGYKAVWYGRTPLESENPGGWTPQPGNVVGVPYTHKEGLLLVEVLDAGPANMGFPNEYLAMTMVRTTIPG